MKLTVVVPAHNEATNLPTLFERLQSALGGTGVDWSMLAVDDGSSDNTPAVLEDLARKSPRVAWLSLSRCFGQQAALTAGLDHAEGDAVVTMDADLQHPPETIPKMIERWKSGIEIVHTRRVSTQDASVFKACSSRVFYPLFRWLSGSRLEPGGADFRLLDRRVLDALRRMPERARFLRGMIGWLGFCAETLEYRAEARLHGVTSYSPARMLLLAWMAIRAFSAKPLHVATWVGVLTWLLGMLYLGYAIYVRLFTNETEPGWTSLLSAVLILGGLQLLCLGLLGEYLALVFEEGKHRPIYVVRQSSNISRRDPVSAGH